MNTAKQVNNYTEICGSKIFPELFQANQIKLPINTENNRNVIPKPNYIFNKEKLRVALARMFSQDLGQTLRLWGPSGSGKTDFVYALGHRMNIEVFSIPIHSGLLPCDVLFSKELVAEGGGVVTKDRLLPLAQAYLYGGIILLDEVDHANEAFQSFLQGLLDGKPLVIPEIGMTIRKHPACYIFATSNTTGEGGSEQYSSTQKENEAFRQRFSFLFFDYLPATEEIKVLKQYWPDLPTELAAKMVGFAGKVRDVSDEESLNEENTKDYNGAKLSAKISTRVLVEWSNWMKALYNAPLTETFDLAVKGAVSKDSWAAVREIALNTLPDLSQSPKEIIAGPTEKK